MSRALLHFQYQVEFSQIASVQCYMLGVDVCKLVMLNGKLGVMRVVTSQ